MYNHRKPQNLRTSVRFALSHTLITLLAIGTAFALPGLARYILYYWWPRIEADAQILLATEILFAAVLATLFNLAMASRDNGRFAECARLASLVHARSGRGWLDFWRGRRFKNSGAAARDAFVMAVTGFRTFVETKSMLRAALGSTYELRVMLADPAGIPGPQQNGDPLAPADGAAMLRELEASIAFLTDLHRSGKKVSLRFYAEPPFWKLVILGEHVWVQYCRDGREHSRTPEYVFALNPDHPDHSLYVPFYMLFLNKWTESQLPEYDFDRAELVHRDGLGSEIRREPFCLAPAIQ